MHEVVILLLVVWAVGFPIMYVGVAIGDAMSHGRSPLWWKLFTAALWPVIVPYLTVFMMWNNWHYRRWVEKERKRRAHH